MNNGNANGNGYVSRHTRFMLDQEFTEKKVMQIELSWE